MVCYVKRNEVLENGKFMNIILRELAKYFPSGMAGCHAISVGFDTIVVLFSLQDVSVRGVL